MGQLQIFYTKDWWSPETLSGNIVSLEPILVGFALGGIASVLYEVVAKKTVDHWQSDALINKSRIGLIILLAGLCLSVFFIGYYLFAVNSLIMTIISSLVGTIFILAHRKDLIIDSLVSGVLFVLVAVVAYWLIGILTPGWIEEFWHFSNTPRHFFLGLPLDDVIWYFFVGMLLGPAYEFYQERRLV